MIFQFPTLIGALALMLLAFLAGFAWTAGSWLFNKIVTR